MQAEQTTNTEHQEQQAFSLNPPISETTQAPEENKRTRNMGEIRIAARKEDDTLSLLVHPSFTSLSEAERWLQGQVETEVLPAKTRYSIIRVQKTISCEVKKEVTYTFKEE